MHRCDTCLEELDDLLHERLIALISVKNDDGVLLVLRLFRKHIAGVDPALAHQTKLTHASIFPGGVDHIIRFVAEAGDLVNPHAHDGDEGFKAVDTVPCVIVVGALRFKRRRRNESRAAYLAVLSGTCGLGDIRKAERRGRKILRIVLLAELVYLERVGKIVRQRLVDENALAAREHLLRLSEMLASVTGFKTHHINL